MSERGERGERGDHGQHGDPGQRGERGERGASGTTPLVVRYATTAYALLVVGVVVALLVSLAASQRHDRQSEIELGNLCQVAAENRQLIRDLVVAATANEIEQGGAGADRAMQFREFTFTRTQPPKCLLEEDK